MVSENIQEVVGRFHAEDVNSCETSYPSILSMFLSDMYGISVDSFVKEGQKVSFHRPLSICVCNFQSDFSLCLPFSALRFMHQVMCSDVDEDYEIFGRGQILKYNKMNIKAEEAGTSTMISTIHMFTYQKSQEGQSIAFALKTNASDDIVGGLQTLNEVVKTAKKAIKEEKALSLFLNVVNVHILVNFIDASDLIEVLKKSNQEREKLCDLYTALTDKELDINFLKEALEKEDFKKDKFDHKILGAFFDLFLGPKYTRVGYFKKKSQKKPKKRPILKSPVFVIKRTPPSQTGE